ncbi:HalOD1 output domain-containing protein [Halorubrum ejinorense]
MEQDRVSERGAIEARERYDWSDTRPSDAVVEVVADVVAGGPVSFGPLYDRIDPDALDDIFRSDGDDRPAAGTRVSFPLAERTVVVHGSGTVVVRTAARDDADE